jgi:nitrite reductase/ring-hydroxylating ferredoxin subunit
MKSVTNGWNESIVNRWHVVARSEDVCPAHVYHGRLLGQELAIWRDSAGALNVWENRCPHRGARLTIGNNLGMELRCQYHGMRYASGSGQCVAIPAHPGQTPSNKLAVRTYDARERYGMVWTRLGQSGDEPSIPILNTAELTPLRSIVVAAPAAAVIEALKAYRFIPSSAKGNADSECKVTVLDPFVMECQSRFGQTAETVVLVVQPAERDKSIVHGTLVGSIPAAAGMAALRHHNECLGLIRDSVAVS